MEANPETYVSLATLSSRSARVASLAAVTLLSCLPPAFVRAEEAELAAVGQMTERLGSTAKIKGDILVGFSVAGTDAPRRPYMEARISAGWAGSTLCLRLVSADGLYEGSREFHVAEDWPGGNARIPIESAYATYLATTDRSEFAAMIGVGTCDDDIEAIAAVSWNETMPKDIADHTVLVNSFRASEVYLIVGGNHEIECSEVDEAQRLAFDFSCRVPPSAINSTGETEIEINRIRSGTFDSPVTVRLAR